MRFSALGAVNRSRFSIALFSAKVVLVRIILKFNCTALLSRDVADSRALTSRPLSVRPSIRPFVCLGDRDAADGGDLEGRRRRRFRDGTWLPGGGAREGREHEEERERRV